MANGNINVVLADFDSSIKRGTGQLYRVGTLPYMAPEILAGWGDEYNFLVDIWSAGVVFAELISL